MTTTAAPATKADFPEGTRVIVPDFYLEPFDAADPRKVRELVPVYRRAGKVTRGTMGAERRYPDAVWVKCDDSRGAIYPEAFRADLLHLEA